MRSIGTSIIAVIIASIATFIVLINDTSGSSDILASWMAGHYYQLGLLDQIYPHDTDVFTMRPPPEWIPYHQSQGRSSDVFPFIYPPIWAHVFGWLTTVTQFETLANWASVINPLLIGSMVILAWRASGSAMPALRFTLLGLLILAFTLIGIVPIIQNQPQIFVSFLIVLALERHRSDAPITAGAAIALAASIKLYPALLALLFLASGNRRAFGSFVITGAILGGLSIALTGWPLHSLFLAEVGRISGTVMSTIHTYSLDAVIGQLFFIDQMQMIHDPNFIASAADEGQIKGWKVMAKPPLWRGLSAVALLATLAFFAYQLRRNKEPVSDNSMLWPVVIICISLLNPISWGYHYLPAVAFAPVLVDRFGTLRGAVLLLLIFAPVSVVVLTSVYPHIDFIPQPASLFGTLSMIGLALAFAVAHRKNPALMSH